MFVVFVVFMREEGRNSAEVPHWLSRELATRRGRAPFAMDSRRDAFLTSFDLVTTPPSYQQDSIPSGPPSHIQFNRPSYNCPTSIGSRSETLATELNKQDSVIQTRQSNLDPLPTFNLLHSNKCLGNIYDGHLRAYHLANTTSRLNRSCTRKLPRNTSNAITPHLFYQN